MRHTATVTAVLLAAALLTACGSPSVTPQSPPPPSAAPSPSAATSANRDTPALIAACARAIGDASAGETMPTPCNRLSSAGYVEALQAASRLGGQPTG